MLVGLFEQFFKRTAPSNDIAFVSEHDSPGGFKAKCERTLGLESHAATETTYIQALPEEIELQKNRSKVARNEHT